MMMENTRPYNEPELQKMAPFLRERCERGQYGLTYADHQKKFIRIPWLTVPRSNEDVSENFGMFKEWAYLSFLKRGNRGDQLETEALSAQKHRFRNALARADGLRHVKDMSTDTMRVYEFVDTKKEKEAKPSPPHFSDTAITAYPAHHIDLINNQSDLRHGVQPRVDHRDWDNCSPISVSSSSNGAPIYSHPVMQYAIPQEMTAPMQEEREPSLGTLIEEMINTPEPTVPYNQPNNDYDCNGMLVTTQVNYTMQSANHVYSSPPEHNRLAHNQQHISRRPDEHVFIKVFFRGQEVMQKSITNSRGFRLYSGNNIPDMRRLLGEEQKNQLQMLTKYPCDELFGPECVDQVEMPAQRESGHRQGARTSEVLHNMDRGVMFVLDYSQSNGIPYGVNLEIPSIYALRLCQTRIFPFQTNVPDQSVLEEEGLKRMQWVLVFDGQEFVRDMMKSAEGRGLTPSSSITFSVGQKPKRDNIECNLVTLKLSITKAKSLIEKFCEDQMEEICISDKSSMDRAAQQHKNEVQSRIQIDDSAVVY